MNDVTDEIKYSHLYYYLMIVFKFVNKYYNTSFLY